MEITAGYFVIEYSNKSEKGFSYNRTLEVVCDTVERAIEMFRQTSPNGVVHVVRRVGTQHKILIDEKLLLDKL